MSVLFLMPEKSKEEWKMPKRKEMCSSVSIEPDKGIVMMSISELHDLRGILLRWKGTRNYLNFDKVLKKRGY